MGTCTMQERILMLFIGLGLLALAIGDTMATKPENSDWQTTMEARLFILETNLQRYMNAHDRLLEENHTLKKHVEYNIRRNIALSLKVENLERIINDIQENQKEVKIRPQIKTNLSQSVNSIQKYLGTEPNKNQTGNYGIGPQFATKQSGKRIASTTPSSATELIAFHSHMSTNTPSDLRQHHTLIFDTVKVNKGQGYHKDDGIFILPRSGVYVFAWTVAIQTNGWAAVEIVINGQIAGATFADGNAGSWDNGAGLIIIEGNVGDHVYIRMHENGRGVVSSNSRGRTTFSGWCLS